MRNFRSEARRLIQQHGMDAPAVVRLGDALGWILFTTGHLKKRHRRGHGRAWQPRAFYGSTYAPRRPNHPNVRPSTPVPFRP